MAAMQLRESIPHVSECRYEELKSKSIELLKRLPLHTARIEHMTGQLYDLNRRLLSEEGKLLHLAENAGIKRQDFLKHYTGNEHAMDWLDRAADLLPAGRGWRESEPMWLGTASSSRRLRPRRNYRLPIFAVFCRPSSAASAR